MKRIVKIGFRHADFVPFRAPSHPVPQHARGLRAPAKRPLRDGDRSIREQHFRAPAVLDRQTRERARAVGASFPFSARTRPPTRSLPEVACLPYAPAIPERRTRECARRRRVVLAFRVDKPVPTSIAGSHASAICARGNRPANAQRAEAVSPLSSFCARTSPPTQSLPEVAYLPYAPATPERQPRERARRRRVVLAFRVDKPVPTSIAGSHSSAVCACGNRPANAQRAEAVSPLSSFSARTSPPTQSLPEVACLPYAPAIPERRTRDCAEAVGGTKGACAG